MSKQGTVSWFSDQAGAEKRSSHMWRRSEGTRRVILEAAMDIFLRDGYTNANVADIVERSGLSVGSIYHHFGGKSELFLALWSEFEAVYGAAVATAVVEARKRGVSDVVELFVIGARAYLEVAGSGSGLALLFAGSDGPPGFEALSRTNGNEWIMRNSQLLGLSNSTADRFRVFMLTSTVSEGGRALSGTTDPDEAKELVEVVLDIVRRLAGQ